MSFAHPLALVFLLALPLLTGVKLLADARGRRAVTRLLPERLRGSLVLGSGSASAWIAHLFELLAIALVIVSIARPQWGFSREETMAEGRDVLIAIDTSRSMLADDLQPNRLVRARLVAQDLIDAMPNDRFGLLAFAGRAFLQAPLTIDHEAIAETLNQIDHEIIPRGGSNLAEPIGIAVEVFEKSESGDHALILFTDGDELEGETIKAARAAKDAGIMVVAVGVGTASGSLIPDPDAPRAGTFIRDPDGNPVRTRLERASLEQIAEITGGAYLNIGTGSTTQKRIADALKKLESSARARKDTRRPIERYQWFLTAAFIAMTLSLLVPIVFQPSSPGRSAITKAAALVALALLLAPSASHAETAGRSAADALAMQAYRSGKFDVATQLYAIAAEDPAAAPTREDRAKLQFGYGSSAYKSGDHEEAIDGFAKALRSSLPRMQENAHYNLGNTLFRRGEGIEQTLNNPEALEEIDVEPDVLFEAIFREWEDAIEHYDATLDLNPDNEDAAFNKDVVERRLERLKQQQQQQQQQQQGEGEGEGDQEGQEGEGEQEGQSGEGGKGDKGQQGDQNEGESGDNPDQDGDGKNDFENPMEKGAGEDGEKEKGPEGKLEALDKGKEQGTGEAKEVPADSKKNNKPGFTKSQARQIIRTFADEDTQARPPIRMQVDDDYKNW